MKRTTAVAVGTLLVLASVTGCAQSTATNKACTERFETWITVSERGSVDAVTDSFPELVTSLLSVELPEPSCMFVGGPADLGDNVIDSSAAIVYVSDDKASVQAIAQTIAGAATEANMYEASRGDDGDYQTALFITDDDGGRIAETVSTNTVIGASSVNEIGQAEGEFVLIVQVAEYAN